MRPKPAPKLPPRLMRCAELVAEGFTEHQIARRMGIKHMTVHAYMHLIYVHLKLQSWGNPRVRLTNWVRNQQPRPSASSALHTPATHR